MNRKSLVQRWFVLVWLGCLVVLGVSSTLGQGVKKWTNSDGRSMEAELMGYNEEEKTVIWRMKDGRRAESPLGDLDIDSKWQAVMDSAFAEVIKKRFETDGTDMGIALLFGGVAFYIFLLIFGLVVDILLFKAAVRVVTFPDRDVLAYFKQIFWVFVFVIAFMVVMIPFAMLLPRGDFEMFWIPMEIVLHLVIFFVTIFVIRSHYGISSGSAFLMMVVLLVFRIFCAVIFFGIFALLIALSVTWLKGLIDPLFLEPLDLI